MSIYRRMSDWRNEGDELADDGGSSPTATSRPRVRGREVWIASFLALALATVALHTVRDSLQQAHVVLVYILIVLAGSAYGGRLLGFLLGVSSFLTIDYFFQTPFDQFTVGNPVDWFVLGAFLITATLAASLLAQAQAAAQRAENRTQEVARLSRLGAELLGSGTAENALNALAEKVRDTARGNRCTVYRIAELVASPSLEPLVILGQQSTTVDAADIELAYAALSSGNVVARFTPSPKGGAAPGAGVVSRTREPSGELRALGIPLHVHDRSVGALTVVSPGALAHDDASRRFLNALSYYAALAVERVTLVAQLEQAEAARETARVREALLASVSHDLRTPLSTIKLLAQEVATHGDAMVGARNAAVIEEQVDRLNGIVSNLLDLTRLRSAAFPMHAEINAVDDLVGVVARQVTGILGDHALIRAIDDRGAVLLGHFDFVQTQRILVNLIENAARYAPPGTAITLHAWRDNEWLRFSVSDVGTGIAPEERERIFEPFYRGPTASVDSGGVGLGLYIGRALAEAQHGSLELAATAVDARTETTFVLSLPAVEGGSTDGEAESESVVLGAAVPNGMVDD